MASNAGHGWPVAVLYSMQKKNPIASATLSSSIIGIGHLASSIAVSSPMSSSSDGVNFDAPWLKYVAAALLVGLAVKLFLRGG